MAVKEFKKQEPEQKSQILLTKGPTLAHSQAPETWAWPRISMVSGPWLLTPVSSLCGYGPTIENGGEWGREAVPLPAPLAGKSRRSPGGTPRQGPGVPLWPWVHSSWWAPCRHCLHACLQLATPSREAPRSSGRAHRMSPGHWPARAEQGKPLVPTPPWPLLGQPAVLPPQFPSLSSTSQ